MKVLGIDPSSTRTGYALMADKDHLLEAGFFKPNHLKDGSRVRVKGMVDDLMRHLESWRPDVAVIEMPSGHVNKNRHRGGGAGLSVYGNAAGSIWTALGLSKHVGEVCAPDENQWTRGVSKDDRQLAVAGLFPAYAKVMDKDKGQDVSDAIYLCLWWYTERLIRGGVGI